MAGWTEFGFVKASGTVTGGRKSRSREKNMEESNLSRLREEITMTEDDSSQAISEAVADSTMPLFVRLFLRLTVDFFISFPVNFSSFLAGKDLGNSEGR